MGIIKDKQNNHWQPLVLLLKNIAKSKGMSHQLIADITGYNTNTINRFFDLRFTPKLDIFLEIAKAIKVNFFFEDQESKTDLNQCFEKAMEELGRRTNKLPKN